MTRLCFVANVFSILQTEVEPEMLKLNGARRKISLHIIAKADFDILGSVVDLQCQGGSGNASAANRESRMETY
jgi:hypothetical protein